MLRDASAYEILYDLPEGEYGERAVGGICTHTITSGDMLEVKAFPITRIDAGARREKLRRSTGIWQQEINHRNSWQRIMRLLEANFSEADLIIHPTYAYGMMDRDSANLRDARREWEEAGIPMDDGEARAKIRNFLARLRRRVRKKGGNPDDMKYLYQIETTCEPRPEERDPLPPHYHCHMALSSCGVLTIDDVNELWPYGYTNARRVDLRFDGLKGFAKYITKKEQKRRRGRSLRWACSRNMAQPIERRSDRRISRRRAARIAADVQADGREILQKIYPGYRVEEVEVKYSDFVAGAYIYARLRRMRV